MREISQTHFWHLFGLRPKGKCVGNSLCLPFDLAYKGKGQTPLGKVRQARQHLEIVPQLANHTGNIFSLRLGIHTGLWADRPVKKDYRCPLNDGDMVVWKKAKESTLWPGKVPSHPQMLLYHWDHLLNVQLRARASSLTSTLPFPSLPHPADPKLLSIPLSCISPKSSHLFHLQGLTFIKVSVIPLLPPEPALPPILSLYRSQREIQVSPLYSNISNVATISPGYV